LGGFFELSSAKIPEQVRRLCVAHALLHFFDLVFNMAVGDQDIEPAIVVVVEEETAKT
jgi:hypothetical protein